MGKYIRPCGHLTNNDLSPCAQCKRNQTRRDERAHERARRRAKPVPILPKVAPSGVPSKHYTHDGHDITFRSDSATFHCEVSGRARVTRSLDSMKGIIDREKGARIEPFWALDVDYSYSPPRLREVKVVGVQQMSFRSMDKSPRWVVQLPKKKKGEGTLRIFRKHLWPDTAKARAAVATLMRIENERVRILDNMAAEETRAKQSGGLMTASFDHPRVKPKKVEIKPVVMKFLRKSK